MHDDVAARFTAALVVAAAALRPGETLAPLARGAPAARLLAAHIADAVSKGATVAFQTPAEHMPAGQSYDATSDGGSARGREARRPLYFPATVLTGCDHAMVAMRDESFGPLVAVQAVRSDGEAAALMNDSPYGLTAAVFSADGAAATAILRRLVRMCCSMPVGSRERRTDDVAVCRMWALAIGTRVTASRRACPGQGAGAPQREIAARVVCVLTRPPLLLTPQRQRHGLGAG